MAIHENPPALITIANAQPSPVTRSWIPGATPDIYGATVVWPAEPGDCPRPYADPVEEPEEP